MDTAITLRELFFIILGIGILVLLGYLIIFFRNLITTIKSTNKVLEDAEKITSIAAERTEDVDKIITNVTESVDTLTENIRGNKSTIGFLGSIINFLTSLKGFISKSTKSDK